jgi:hypothetical protein
MPSTRRKPDAKPRALDDTKEQSDDTDDTWLPIEMISEGYDDKRGYEDGIITLVEHVTTDCHKRPARLDLLLFRLSPQNNEAAVVPRQ